MIGGGKERIFSFGNILGKQAWAGNALLEKGEEEEKKNIAM
jgi:hypothetical protein